MPDFRKVGPQPEAGVECLPDWLKRKRLRQHLHRRNG
jgi:hypothetical protein